MRIAPKIETYFQDAWDAYEYGGQDLLAADDVMERHQAVEELGTEDQPVDEGDDFDAACDDVLLVDPMHSRP